MRYVKVCYAGCPYYLVCHERYEAPWCVEERGGELNE